MGPKYDLIIFIMIFFGYFLSALLDFFLIFHLSLELVNGNLRYFNQLITIYNLYHYYLKLFL